MKNKKGFTLVEILAVIVLISLIVIIAIPSVKSISAKSKRKLFDTKVKIAEEALNMWAEANSSCFEEGSDGCGILDGCTIDVNGNTKCIVTFEKLASNGIIDYDLVEGDNKYVIDPTINESMNKYIIDVVFDKNTKLVTSSFDESDENKKVAEKIITTKKSETIISTSNAIIDEITSSTTSSTTTSTTTTATTTTTQVIKCNSFSSDDWSAIKYNIVNNNSSCYKVGDEKEVKIEGTNYTVRIANRSTPSECSNEGFSQTACGFVIEFVDIIEEYPMNSNRTNDGGWPATEMREYLNQTIFNKLTLDLQKIIISTKVVSGHGSSDTGTRSDGNFETNDNLYLLNVNEIYAECNPYNNTCYDTALAYTRQLDYYTGGFTISGITTGQITMYNYSLDNLNSPIKPKENGAYYWLRTASSKGSSTFYLVENEGSSYPADSNRYSGIAPAFRIG